MRIRQLTFAFVVLLLASNAYAQQNIEYLNAQPMTQVVQGRVQPVSSDRRVPTITWGGDVATILADLQGVFKKEGLDVEVYTQNDFVKQVEDVLAGRTPYLRGTVGMVNAANEVFERNGLKLRVVYQISWSNGDDAVVVRSNIKKTSDLCSATIALQRYGPHMDYVANVLKSAGCSNFSRVKFKWLRELTLPTYDTKGRIVDPVSAFRQDSTIDAVMAIIPDALSLTSDGKVGTGAEGSVKGARILLTTQTANRIIPDVYAVREDYYQVNKGKVEKFTHALMTAQEQLDSLLKAKSQRQAEYRQLVAKSATLLFGASQATAEVEGLLAGGCYFVGHTGNVQFFTGAGTTRTFNNLNSEIQTSFTEMGLVAGKSTLLGAEWNFNALAVGLATAKTVTTAAPAPTLDRNRAEARVAKEISAELSGWEEGTLFVVEINFEPNQKVFTETQYANDFAKAIKLVQTYGGALVTVEGHSDPMGLAQAKQKGENAQVLAQIEQAGKNLSLDRANAVKASFLTYAKKNGVALAGDDFIAVGLGIRAPKFGTPKTKDEWLDNMRVVFRIKNIEAELSEFKPL